MLNKRQMFELIMIYWDDVTLFRNKKEHVKYTQSDWQISVAYTEWRSEAQENLMIPFIKFHTSYSYSPLTENGSTVAGNQA